MCGDESSTDGLSDAEAALLDEVRQAVAEHDPVPAHVVAGAKAAFAWRTVDAELAALTADSVTAAPAAAGVRDQRGGLRLLTFEADEVTIELEVHDKGDRRKLVGQIVPPRPVSVEVRQDGGTQRHDTDAIGRFVIDEVQPGPVSLRCRLGDSEDAAWVHTDWVVV